MNRYELMTLDAGGLLETTMSGGRDNGIYSCNYEIDDPAVKKKILKSVERHMDNALLFQIRECLKAGADAHKAEDAQADTLEYGPEGEAAEEFVFLADDSSSLLRRLIYVDFGNIFSGQMIQERRKSGKPAPYDPRGKNKNKSESEAGFTEEKRDVLLSGMFTHGITLIYEDGTQVRYLPFDKSANMARHYKMTFVDEALLASDTDEANLEKRLSLDIDLSKEYVVEQEDGEEKTEECVAQKDGEESNEIKKIKKQIKVVPSKYYAYRGLYLTDAYRIENSSEYPLNEETVIVINDAHDKLENRYVFTIDADAFREQNGELVEKCGNDDIEVTPFDGEGIISPEYAAYLNEQRKPARGYSRRSATSFQIRMPYTKGMLHQVDFHEFVDEFVSHRRHEIVDMFGIRRDLSKVQIILTKSMFKCHGWLKEYVELEQGKDADPMKYFFNEFHKYNHALYVGNTNLNLSRPGRIKMNYQFLNTLDMDADTFREIMTEHMDASESVTQDNLAKGRERLLENAKARGEDDEEYVVDLSLKSWEYALAYNPAFAYDPFISKRISDESRAMLNGTVYGRAEVDGAIEYLSHDLFAFMIHVIGQLHMAEGKKAELKGKLLPHTLYQNSFYTADAAMLGLKHGVYYGVLRNPHLSRNEECALKPYIPSGNSKQKIARDQDGKPVNVYVKYFSHLKGVLMVSYRSDAPAVLGGADFDGDYVKIVTDERVNQAILKGSYEKNPEGVYERKLPIPWIPGVKGSSRSLNRVGSVKYYEEMYGVTKQTFDNRVGLISNNAIITGGAEYYGTPEQQDKYKNKCALLTIVTGLDLDAVKTGIRPKEPEYPDGKSLYLGAKSFCDTAGLNDYRNITFTQRDDGSLTVRSKGKKSNGEKLRVSKADSADGRNIDMLPYLFFGRACKFKESKAKVTSEETLSRIYFEFQREPGWEAEFEDPAKEEVQWKLDALRRIRGAYSRLNSEASKLKRQKGKRSNSNNMRIVHNILATAYDEYLPETGMDIHLAADLTYLTMKELLTDRDSVQEADGRRREEDWEMLDLEDSREALPRILGIEEEPEALTPAVREVLLSKACRGYKILPCLLAELKLEYKDTDTGRRTGRKKKSADPEARDLKDSKVYDPELFERLLDIYYRAQDENRQTVIYIEEVRNECVNAINELFGGDMDAALRYCFYLRWKAVMDGKKWVDQGRSFFWEMFDTETIAVNMVYKDDGTPEDEEDADAG